jgi:hypothetical protein
MLADTDLYWLQLVSGYESGRIVEAVNWVESLGLPRLSEQIGRASSADGHVAAMMLRESYEWLAERGVSPVAVNRMLRRPDVWPMWAQLRAAGLIAHLLEDVDAVEFDVQTGTGRKNADFGFHFSGEAGLLPVEFKALSLSYAEQCFCRDYAHILHSLKPLRGFCVLHADIDTPAPLLNRQRRRWMCQDAARRVKHLPPRLQDISGTVVVAHGSADDYIRRMARTISEHLTQLPSSGEGWIALHWGNGAPPDMVKSALVKSGLPERVAGVMLVGSAIVLDGTTHHIAMMIPRDGEERGEWESYSKVGFDFTPIRRGFQVSAGVRPCVIRVNGENGQRDLIVRDGSEQFWPFNLLIEPDPPGVGDGLDRPRSDSG